MNCPRCDYLLWELQDDRCPECALPFEATDFAFQMSAVHFVCRDCGQSYLGNDERGLPKPRRFDCVRCRRALDAGRMLVRPIRDDARGRQIRSGTPWEHRDDVGLVRGFLDGVARLAIQPGEYFRQCYDDGNHSGAATFSIICAYVAAGLLGFGLVFAAAIAPGSFAIANAGPLGMKFLLFLLMLIPVAQITWNYSYGLLIQVVLFCLGQRDGRPQQSVRAVALGSAVLPALVLLPPVGLAWYVSVVASGVEHLQGVTRGRAILASLVPVLLAANVGVIALFMIA